MFSHFHTYIDMSNEPNPTNTQNSNGLSRIEAGAKRLVNCMPAWQTRIEHLAKVDPDFREICEDYEEVSQVLGRWRKLSSADSNNMIEAYETLLQELEAEAKYYVQEFEQR